MKDFFGHRPSVREKKMETEKSQRKLTDSKVSYFNSQKMDQSAKQTQQADFFSDRIKETKTVEVFGIDRNPDDCKRFAHYAL